MILSNFVERLKELIFENEITVKQLSESLGCENATVSHYLTGRYLPTLEMTVRLADYFNCTIDFLLGIANENEATKFQSCPPFGAQLIKLCEYFGISRYKLQQLTGISESVMRYWVQGKTKPSITNIAKIAQQLNCSIDFVLGREI